MAEFKSIPIKEILVGERLRDIEEDHAQAIAISIRQQGLITPISVRATPAAKGGNYTLVAGAHRLRAAIIAGLDAIDAVVVKADKAEAQLLEISENLFRNELSVIDRAIFVQKWREIWEDSHGKIERGGDRKSNHQVGGLIGDNWANLAQLSKGQVGPLIEGSFSDHVANRLGLSTRSAKRLDQLARHLHPELRAVLRGSPIADNQSALLKLAKLDHVHQHRAAVAFGQCGDLRETFRLIEDEPAPKPSRDTELLSRLIDTWGRANEGVRAQFLEHIKEEAE